MAGRPVDEEILKMSLDNSAFMRDIDRTIASLNKFKANVEKSVDVKATGFDRFTQSIGQGISGLLSKIPILSSFRKSAEDSANINPSIFSKFSSGVGAGVNAILSKVPILNRFKKSTEDSINVSSAPMDRLAGQVGSDVSRINNSLGLIQGGAQKATQGFTALQAIAFGALSSIGSFAVSKGAEIAQSLAIKPLTEGFEQYSNKMSAVIMLQGALGEKANGTINKNLADLDHYAMVTKYSVADMQQNLSQFVNNGVQIDTASVAIKGFGNLAASAGASTQGFSSALQFGVQQALAMGKMTTQNWMSIENAGMATQKFKDALVAQAKSMGKNVDMTNGFRDSLQKGWLTNDVFIATLNKMAKDKSMLKMAQDFHSFGEVSDAVTEGVVASWSDVYETLIGGAKDSTKIWTDFGNAAITATQGIPTAVEGVAKEFIKLGGRKAVIETISNAFHSMQKIVQQVKDSFKNVFPVTNNGIAKTLVGLFKDLSGAMKVTQPTINAIGTVFRGLFSALDLGIRTVKAIGTAIGNMIPKNVHTGIGDLVLRFADWLTTLDRATKKGEGMKTVLDTIANSTKTVGAYIQTVADRFKGFGNVLSSIGSGAIKALGFVLKSVGDGLKGIFGAMDHSDIANLAGLGILAVIANKVSGVSKAFKGMTKAFEGIGDKLEGALKVFDALPDLLENLTAQVKSKTLMNIAIAIGVLAGALFTLSTIPLTKLVTALTGVGAGLKILMLSLGSLSNLNVKKLGSLMVVTLALNGISTAMLTLSGALKIMSTIKPAAMATALAGLSISLGVMVGALRAMGKIGPQVLIGAAAMNMMASAIMVLTIPIKIFAGMSLTEIAKGLGTLAGAMGIMVTGLLALSKVASGPKVVMAAGSMVALATAMNIMAGAIKILGGMKLSDIAKGLVGIGGGVAIMGVAAAKIKNPANLIGLSTAMLILAKALKQMGSMSLAEIGKSFIALAGGLTILGVAMSVIKSNVGGAIAMGIMATAMIPLAQALSMMAKIPLEGIGTGLLAFGGAALIMVGASKGLNSALPGVLGFIGASAGMLILATALEKMGNAMTTFSKIPLGSMAVAIGGMAAALGLLIGAGMLASPAAVGMLALSASIAMIGAGVAGVGLGVYDLVRAFDVLAKVDMTTALNNFKKLIDVIIAEVPKIIDMVIKALGQLLDGAVELMPKLAKAIGTAIDGLSSVIPNVVKFVGKFIEALEVLVPKMVKLAQDIIIAFLKGIQNIIPQLVATGVTVVQSLLAGILSISSDIINTGIALINMFLMGIANEMPILIAEGTAIIVNFLEGIAEGLPKIINAAADVIIAFIKGLATAELKIVNAAADTLITFINGLADAVDTKGPQLNAAIWKLMNAVVNDIINFLSGGQVNKTGQNTIQSFIGGAVKKGATIWNNIASFFTNLPGQIWRAISGIGSQAARGFGDFVNNARNGASRIWGNIAGFFVSLPGRIWGAIASLGSKGAQAIGSFISSASGAAGRIWGSISGFFSSIPDKISGAIGDLGYIGGHIVDGVARGISNGMGNLGGALRNLASSIPNKVAKFLGIASPSRVMRDKVGVWIPAGIAAGIAKGASQVDNAATGLANATLRAMDRVQDHIDGNMQLSPIITPVIDTTNIDAFNFNQGLTGTIQNGRNLPTPVIPGATGPAVAMTGDINIPVNVPYGTTQEQTSAITDHLRGAVKTIISDEIRKAL